MTNKTINHFRLLYAALYILVFCLLLTAGAYSRLKNEREATTERLDAFTLWTMKENVRLDAEIAAERRARKDFADRLSEWEALYPKQAEAFRQRGIACGWIIPNSVKSE